MSESEPIRILCMEDDPGAARLVQKTLDRAGYAVDIARNGREGLDMHDAGAYALLLVDQSMPVFEGLEVLRRLSSRESTVPGIISSKMSPAVFWNYCLLWAGGFFSSSS
jgi:DNA-binding response OmpR family regulator